MKTPGYEQYTFYSILLATSLGSNVPLKDCPKRCTCKHAIINKDSLEVNCAGAGLSTMPLTLPPAQTYRLLFGRNNISELEPRNYLRDTDYLDLSYNGLREIRNNALRMLESQMRYLYLHDNELGCLPHSIQRVDLSHVHEITLYSNPWKCACANLWMKDWVEKHSNIILEQRLLCKDQVHEGRHLQQKQESQSTHSTRQPVGNMQEKHALFAFVMVLTSLGVIYGAAMLVYFYKNHSKQQEQKQKVKDNSDTVVLINEDQNVLFN